MSNAAIPLYVGMTTLPSRLAFVRDTIESLLAQQKRPDRIFLSLPKISAREKCSYELPSWIAEYFPILEVVECDIDYGPGTKALGCLDRLAPDGCLVLADDDMVYKPFFLDILYREAVAHPGTACSFYTYPSSNIIVGQGADGFCMMVRDLGGMYDYGCRSIRNPQLRVVDDLWISAYLKSRGIRVESLKHKIPDNQLVYEIVHDVNQLHDMAGSMARETAMSKGAEYLAENGMLGRPLQAKAMVKKLVRLLTGKH